MTMAITPSSEHPASSKQARMREKAEKINLVLLEPDVDLWKLRELALSEGGLVNDTLRRRAWPKLVGLISYHGDETESNATTASNSTTTTTSPRTKLSGNGRGTTPRKGTAPFRVTNFGDDEDERPSTAFTGGPFDQHDTAAAAPTPTEDDNSSLASDDSANKKSDITECQDAEQIERDVTRCTWHLLTGSQRSRRRIMVNKHRQKVAKVLRRKQRRLGDLINLTLAQSELDLPHEQRLCYYQGYHDVASIFLAALGGASTKAIQHQQEEKSLDPPTNTTTTVAEQACRMGLDLSSRVLYQISMSHFREPMRNNFLQLQTTLRVAFFPLLALMDPELHAYLYGCGMEPFFALSWVITWFSHDIRDTALVKRLFDVFLVSHPLMPIYLSVAMLCHPNNRQEVLATPQEFAELHNTLAGLPKNSSMVGWKYRVGDGYVSDDEEVGEDGATSISLDSDMASHMSNDKSSNRGGQTSLLSGREGGMGRDNLILSEGHAHVVSMGIPAHVPFQDLIDLAINFMHRVPPRKLLAIAQRYYGPEQSEPMLKMYPEISFFHPPPAWALARSAKADWVLKQRARERLGLSSKSRKDRRALSELRNRTNTATTGEDILPSKTPRQDALAGGKDLISHDNAEEKEEKCTPEMIEVTARELHWPKAMIAQGFGPGEDEVAKRKRRRRMILIGSAVTVAVIAIAVGASMKSQSKTKPQVQQQNSVMTSPEKSSSSKSRHAKKFSPRTSTRDAKKSSTIVKNMKAAARDLFAENESSGNCPVDISPTPERRNAPQVERASEPTTATAVGSAIDTGVQESVLQTIIQRMIINHLKTLAYQIQWLVQTIDTNVNDTDSRSNVQKRITDHVKAASGYVADFTIKAFTFTRRQAREHLGGDTLEDLGLL